MRTIAYNQKQTVCPTCLGKKWYLSSAINMPMACLRCRGTGQVTVETLNSEERDKHERGALVVEQKSAKSYPVTKSIVDREIKRIVEKREKAIKKKEKKPVQPKVPRVLAKDTLRKTIEKFQARYLETRDVKDLLPMSSIDLIPLCGLDPSRISLLIKDMRVQGIPAKELFNHSIKGIGRKSLLHSISVLWFKNPSVSDSEMVDILYKELGVYVSRRTMTKYRSELGIKTLTK